MYNKDGIKVWFKDVPLLTISEERMCCMKGYKKIIFSL